MDDYQQTSGSSSFGRHTTTLRQSLNRTSRYSRNSVSPSTSSWVYSNQQNPPGPPPAHGSLSPTSPERELAPLPNPFKRKPDHGHRPLHVVNLNTPIEDEEYMEVDINVPGLEPGYRAQNFGRGGTAAPPGEFDAGIVPNSKKKKSFVRKVFGGVRRLPSVMFGYGAGMGVPGKGSLARRGTFGTDVTSGTGNTLPRYTSNPSSPVVAPGRSGPNAHYMQPMQMAISEQPESEIPQSPPPDVVRLSDTMSSQIPRRQNRGHRVAPPSESTVNEDVGLVYPTGGPSRFVEQPMSESSVSNNPVDRTTVMVYTDRYSQYPDNNSHIQGHTPPLITRQLSSGPGLSYTSSESHPPLQPLRPASFVASLGPVPTDAPPPPMTSTALGPRVSYASQVSPRRPAPLSPIPGSVMSASPVIAPATIDGPISAPGPGPGVMNLPPATVPADADAVLSPVSARPLPAEDYLKMTLSPPPTSHDTQSATTFSYEPSFSSQLSPVERFFKTLYNMPWVSHDRVTVDYRPGEGIGSKARGLKKKRVKPLSSWYQSMLSRSRRNSATLDLLSNGTGGSRRQQTSPRGSFGAGLALALGSPLSGSRRSGGRSADRAAAARRRAAAKTKPRRRNDHHHSPSDRHHDHHGHRRHENRRHTATTTDTANTRDDDSMKLSGGSPLMPAMYPYAYPSYPYAGYQTFPVAAPAIPALPPGQLQSAASPNGLRASPQGSRVPPTTAMFAGPPAGYPSYQPMYVLQQMAAPHTAGGSVIPPALVPGENSAGQAPPPVQGQTQPQSQPKSSQTIPGAFA